MTISVLMRGEGETITAGPMSLRIVVDGALTDHRLGVVEITIPPGVQARGATDFRAINSRLG